MGRGDTLFAFDAKEQRISAFAEDGERRFAYSLAIPLAGASAAYEVLAPEGGGFLVQLSAPFTPGGAVRDRRVRVHALASDGTLAPRPLAELPDREFLVLERAGSITVTWLPYGREPFLRLGPGDRVYAGWSDSLPVSVMDVEGRPLAAVGGGSPRVEVSRGDLRRLMESYGEASYGKALRLRMETAARGGRLPRTRPAYRDLLVDDQGRVWIQAVTARDVVVSTGGGLAYAGEDEAAWRVYAPGGGELADVRLPQNFKLWRVRGGRAYGVETDDLGVERLVRYRLPS